MTELIITEKPSSAKKIAEALADTKAVRKKHKQGFFYELKHSGKSILVTSAVGHLYGLVEKDKQGWTYPVFDIKWAPSYEESKDLKYVKDYVDTIKALAKKSKEFTIACDYDVEGEVIGLNVIRFACGKKDANRMKFSTLTKGELVKAYENKSKTLDWGQAYAGETRHKLDWYYGINVSRALTKSVQAAGSFKLMSAGRVQGPALKMLVEREREINAFVPEPYWEINLKGKFKKEGIEGAHREGKIFDKKRVDQILKKTKDKKDALVTDIKRTQRKQAPPIPFNLTGLQTEAYSQFKITPKQTLAIAQTLYLGGVTSYPRTSSQQLDPKLGFANILKDLSKQSGYKDLCAALLKLKDLKPNNGKKTDPAHPAIYPTGQQPKGLKPREQKVYDLIVRRFMATFGKPAVRETMEVSLDVNGEDFVTKGTRTVEENWHVYYKPYVRLDEVTLPDMKKSDKITAVKIKKEDKQTQPPKRYNQSSIIKELEKRNLGTKATRADILDRLFQRGYVEGVQIHVTKLGMETIDILEKHAPTIIDEKLTADFEEEMELIRGGKHKEEKVLSKAEKTLTKLLADFKKKEKVIGEEILTSVKAARKEAEHQRVLGTDPKTGKEVSVRIARYGPVAQLGKRGEEEKPHYAPLPKDAKLEEITLKEALALFSLPKVLGKTKEGEEVSVGIGPYGPFVKFGKKYVSLKEEDNPYKIKLKRALELVEEKKKLDANRYIKEFEEAGVKVMNGMYGPYISDGKKNARVPKDKDPKELTLKECKDLLAKSKPARKFTRKKK